MAANMGVGVAQHLLWSWFALRRFRQRRRWWAATPGLVVAWVMLVMSLELLDFPPLWGVLDAHSLWHLGTIAPTMLWYKCVQTERSSPLLSSAPDLADSWVWHGSFLVKDAQDDIAASERLKE
jgi:hypothetical protein